MNSKFLIASLLLLCARTSFAQEHLSLSDAVPRAVARARK
jgi:hypothetical protein